MREMGKCDRIVCEAKCILNFDGVDSRGDRDISLSGALIKLNGKMPDSIQPGSYV